MPAPIGCTSFGRGCALEGATSEPITRLWAALVTVISLRNAHLILCCGVRQLRGLIVNPGIEVGGPETFSVGDEQNSQDLLVWLLFWDQLAVPQNGVVVIGLSDDYQFLEQKGVLRHHHVSHAGGEFTQICFETRARVFSQLEASEPGSWAVGVAAGNWPGPDSERHRALRVQLASSIPVPNQDVPLEDVLNFREKRRDEREALMSHIDGVYLSVVSSPDKPLAEHKALGDLAASCKAQLEVTSEARFNFRLMDLMADFNIVPAAAAALGTIALGGAWPLAVGNSLIAGGSITIEKVAGFLNPKKDNSPYRYITSYHQEVFRPE